MYKKSYIHLSSCMMNDDDKLFQHTYKCNENSFFNKVAQNRKIVDTYDQYGYPAHKVYENNKHIMTYDATQSTIFSSVIIEEL